MRAVGGAAVLFLLGIGACEREQRAFREVAPATTPQTMVQTTGLEAGPRMLEPSVAAYQENRWAVSQGQILYLQFNCAGCHSPGGGGGMGPPLTDDAWIYGSEPENIFATVVEGRPNGMPSYRGRIGNTQLWQLVAYVRSLSGLTPPDTWPGRMDHLRNINPERDPTTQRPQQ